MKETNALGRTVGNSRGLDDFLEPGDRRQGRAGLISSSDVGSANRNRVVQALFDLGPTSRAELARHADVNRSTMTGILQPLLDKGLLVEGEPLPANNVGGKPARPLWFAADAKPLCGVLLMHDGVRAALVSMDGRIRAENWLPFDSCDVPQSELLKIIFKCVQATLKRAGRAPFGIGVAVAGMVDTDSGSIVDNAMTPGLGGLRIRDEVQGRFGLPTFVDHHPRALLLGDRWFGAGRGKNSFAVLYVTKGIGSALFLNGRVLRGPKGTGGELGHTRVHVGGALCHCGQRGCLETIATLGWLRREAGSVGLSNADKLDFRLLTDLVSGGSSDADLLLRKFARNLAYGIANLQQIVVPGMFILHGDIAAGGQTLLDAIAREVNDLLPWHPGAALELVLGDAGYLAGMRGAAGLVLAEMLQIAT
ncbi:ROK family protein [Paraburkholderia sp. Ac-20342]|uniref:ROK family transcriptional regulator n=1 Tax=Paraburkholderia sp. Ac-20342 TaxID=2703889 RepID=UPI00197E103F|nr:ROK family transcriptional regulator [Paraburkholderia sp. Ac-20342]MBN3848339.1 ROK family protein [Paraburkholderia sp. Ac-20342]